MITFPNTDNELNHPAFLQLIRASRQELIQTSTPKPIDSGLASRCRNNFYRLLRELNYNHPEYHEIALMINGLKSSREFDNNLTHVFLPNPTLITRLLSTHKTTYPKSSI